MSRINLHQLSSPIRGGRFKNLSKGLLTLVLLFLGSLLSSAQTGVKEGTEFMGNAVYTNTGTEEKRNMTLSSADYLTFTVLTATTSKSSNGTVKVKATADSNISGALNIPSVVYVYSGGSYYPYCVTEVDPDAFENQTGITDVFFTADPFYKYQVTSIGENAFAGTTGLTGTLQLPRTITSIGDNAFGVNTTTPIANVVIGANYTEPSKLKVGADVFKGRTITNLHLLGNFGSNITISNKEALFSKDNVTNVCYYGDGNNDSYYDFLTAINNKGFGLPGQNLYLPSDEIKSFVDNCTANNHTGWIPSTINCLTFEHEVNGIGKFTFMITTTDIQNGGALLAVHAAKFDDGVINPTLDFSDDKKWKTDLMPTATSLTPDVTMIDSKAFAGNDNLQSITIIPANNEAVTIKGDAFSGVKSLRYIDLSQSGDFNVADGYTLSRIPTTKFDENTPYKYTKGTDGKGTYDYELTSTNPFGGLPAYTLVFLPTNIEKYPSGSTETVYKTDGTTATNLTRSLDENFVLWKSYDEKYTCNNFGVYDITALDNTTATGQKYSWYSFLNPYNFTAANSKFYRQFSAGVPSSVCLPFQPAATSDGKFYTYKSDDNKHIVIKTVDTPLANTPYFFYPSNNATLSSTASQTIGAVTTAEEKPSNNLYGVYAGKSFAGVSNAYGMASTAFTYNGKDYPAGTFVKFTDKAYLNPFRAYLLLSGSSAKSAVMEMVVDDTPTGITNQPTASNAETSYYNLQGMRVTAPTKGIFIHNGKKIVK